jgi:hypothetical protein
MRNKYERSLGLHGWCVILLSGLSCWHWRLADCQSLTDVKGELRVASASAWTMSRQC